MRLPLDDKLNITVEDLYDDLYLDYFEEKTKKAFPSVLSDKQQYQILVRVMAWAVARSYQQPRILKYLYNPDLVLDVLMPRLADTLGFTYPLEYPLAWLRVLLKYIQKIRRSRGTFGAIKKLIRLLEISEEEVLSLSFKDYTSVDVEEIEPGFLLVHYNRLNDFDFLDQMMRLVMPAGNSWRIESSLDTKGASLVYRNRVDFVHFKEKFYFSGDVTYADKSGKFSEHIEIEMLNQPADKLFPNED